MFCNQSDYEVLHNLIQTAPNADEGKTSQKELFRYLVNKTGFSHSIFKTAEIVSTTTIAVYIIDNKE